MTHLLHGQNDCFVHDEPTVPSLETHRPLQHQRIGTGGGKHEGFTASRSGDQKNRQGFTRETYLDRKPYPTEKSRGHQNEGARNPPSQLFAPADTSD